MAKALELALNDGRSMITGEQIGLPTPAPEAIPAVSTICGEPMSSRSSTWPGLNILATLIGGEAQKRRGHCPLMSSLLDDCLVRRRDLVFGGTRYNLPGIAIYGPTNVYDGLMAMRRYVCARKTPDLGRAAPRAAR